MATTDEHLKAAFGGESQANRKYTAFAERAMQEGHPEVAQLFLEAAGAETTHALNHLRVMGGINDTCQNLEEAAYGESYEIDEMYPKFIAQAEQEGRHDAADSFRLALDREKHHRQMFREALERYKAKHAA